MTKGEIKDYNILPNKALQGNYYRDMVIVQFNSSAFPDYEEEKTTLENEDKVITNKYIRPMNEFDFLKMMAKRPNDEFWKKMDMIQT